MPPPGPAATRPAYRVDISGSPITMTLPHAAPPLSLPAPPVDVGPEALDRLEELFSATPDKRQGYASVRLAKADLALALIAEIRRLRRALPRRCVLCDRPLYAGQLSDVCWRCNVDADGWPSRIAPVATQWDGTTLT